MNFFHHVFINGAPGNDLYVNEKDVFLGERFFGSSVKKKKKKVHKKEYIGRYKSVHIPKPYWAKEGLFEILKTYITAQMFFRSLELFQGD